MRVTVDVYADLLFFINAGMDGLCLALTARLTHRPVAGWRLLLGAILGGMYAVAALFMEASTPIALAADGGMCLLMCAAVFARREARGWRRLLGAALVFVVLSMVMGGVMTALFGLFNRLRLYDYLPAGEDGMTGWLFALLSLAGGVIALWGGRLFRRSAARVSCRVRVEVDGRTAELSGISDSGNLLRDPIGGRPVICVDGDALGRGISPSLLSLLRSGGAGTDGASPEELRRLCFIPTATATGTGMLVGLRADRVTLTVEGRRGPTEREVAAIIAVGAEGLGSSEGMDGPLEALVPSELIA